MFYYNYITSVPIFLDETTIKEENQVIELIEPALDKLPKIALNALAVLKEELDNGNCITFDYCHLKSRNSFFSLIFKNVYYCIILLFFFVLVV